MLLLGWGKRRGNEWEAVRVYKESWPIFWRSCRRHIGPSEFGEGGPGSGVHLWKCIIQKVVKAGHWNPHHWRVEESGSKKQQVGFFLFLPLSPFMPQCSPLRQVLCRKRNPCCSSPTLASEGRRWGCGWDAISDHLAPECQSKVSSATVRHNPIAIQGAKRCWGPPAQLQPIMGRSIRKSWFNQEEMS